MKESSTAPNQWNIRQRPLALLGILALILLQFSTATHQFQHVDGHDQTVCELCSVFSQLDDVAVSSASSERLSTMPVTVVATEARDCLTAPLVSPYRSRAPPLS